MDKELILARSLLSEVTPLRRDCGRLCGAACCSPDEDGQGGMLLFPGEEELYDPLPDGFVISDTCEGKLLECSGTCDRCLRPLSCMLFPLWISERENGALRLKMDRRGRYVCPLTDYGIRALDPAFTQAVRQAGEALIKNEKQRAFLKTVDEQIEQLARTGLEE